MRTPLWNRSSWLGWLLVLTVLGSGCISTNVASFESDDHTGLTKDERRLWSRALEEQELLNASSHIFDADTALVRYVNHVAQRLVPEAATGTEIDIQVRLIRSPYLNAFAYPNGAIYVHTGLLARMENEAQLATLLGHEISHVLDRHALRNVRSLKNKSGFAAIFSLASYTVGGLLGSLIGVMGQVGAYAAVQGYSQSLEADADVAGLRLMAEAGYDPHEAGKLFQLLQQDLALMKEDEPFFWGSHPRLQQRLQTYQHLLNTTYGNQQGLRNPEPFRTHAERLQLMTIEQDLGAGRNVPARLLLEDYLDTHPTSAQAHYLHGQYYRQAEPDADSLALAAYAEARTHAPGFAPAYQAAGMLHYQAGRLAEAEPLLTEYLRLHPSASDRGYIQQYLRDIRQQLATPDDSR